MITNFSEIQVNIETKMCRFYIQQDMPLNHVKEVLFQLQKYIGHVEDQYNAKMQEEVKPEVQDEPKPE